MHQEVLLHALLGQVAQLLHGLIHALAGTKLLHRAQCVTQQYQGHPENDLDACKVRKKRAWVIRAGISVCPMQKGLIGSIPVLLPPIQIRKLRPHEGK